MSLYQKLIKEKHNGRKLSIDDLTEGILRTLYMEEEVAGQAIAQLFETTKKKVDYKRLKYGISFIERVKNSAQKDEKFLETILEIANEDRTKRNPQICALSFSVTSSRTDIPIVFLEDCDTNEWEDNMDPLEKYFTNIHIDIYGYPNEELDDDEKVKVGVLWGIIIESELTMDDYSFLEVCDIHSQKLCNMASEITVDSSIIEKVCDFDRELFYLDRIFIEPEYRGYGIGRCVINILPQILKYSLNIFLGSIVILPKAQERNAEGRITYLDVKDLDKQKTVQLIKYYKSIGFKLTKNHKLMYKKLDE